MNVLFETATSDRVRVCRICSSNIDRNEKSLVMRNIRISANVVDLHFHPNCFEKKLKELNPDTSI